MTIYTNGIEMGSRPSNGIFTSGVRFGGPSGPQIVSLSYNMHYAFKVYGATCIVTPIADTLSWRVQGNVGASGWFKGYIVFKSTIISGSYGNTHIDAEVTCYAGSDGPENINLNDSNPVTFSGPDPTLTDAGSEGSMAIGETKWVLGSGGLVYQTGYFSIQVSGDYHSGSTVDAYFRINRLRWGSVIIWDSDNKEGILTSNVRLSHD